MDRFRMLPSYHYVDNTDGILEKSIGKPLRNYQIYGNDNGIGDKTNNLFNIGSVNDYFVNATEISINGDTITGLIKKDAIAYTINTAQKFTPGTYSFYAEATMLPRMFIRLYDENDQIITNEQTTINWWTWNSYYQGFMYNSLLMYANIPDTVSYWQVGFIFHDPDNVGGYGDVSKFRIYEGRELYNNGEIINVYEPYGYKIPITVNDYTYNLYLSKPLKNDEYIDYKAQKAFYQDTSENISLPQISTNSGTNIITINTTIQPDKVNYQYYKGGKEHGSNEDI